MILTVNVMNVTNVTIIAQSCMNTGSLASLILAMERERLYVAEIKGCRGKKLLAS